MEAAAQELKKKRGTESLVELHESKMKKQKSGTESSRSGPSNSGERKPFDREVDLQVNRFDEAAKKTMLKNAAKLNNRFSSGQHKYL